MAHGDIAVVAAEKDLVSLCDDLAVRIEAGIDRSFSAAGADRLDLGQRIAQLHETLCAGEETGQKIGAQTETQHRQVLVVHKLSELVYLLRRKELGLVGDYYIVPADLMIVVDMEKSALEAWDASALHRRWKERFGSLLASKAIFDCE